MNTNITCPIKEFEEREQNINWAVRYRQERVLVICNDAKDRLEGLNQYLQSTICYKGDIISDLTGEILWEDETGFQHVTPRECEDWFAIAYQAKRVEL